MATNDALGRLIPAAGDPADATAWLGGYSLSHPGIVEVGSLAAANALRTAYHAACTDAGVTPKPLMVWRTDIENLERETPGGGWEYVAGRQHGATVLFSRPDVNAGITPPRSLYAEEFVRASPGWTMDSEAHLVIPQSGMYVMSAQVNISGAASSLGRTFFEFETNNTGFGAHRRSSTNEDNYGGSAVGNLNKGDQLRIRVYHATGGQRAYTATLDIAMINSPRYV